METNSTKQTRDVAGGELFAGDDWFDPLEAGVRLRIRGFIEAMLEDNLDVALSRQRYARPVPADGVAGEAACGHRHGHRERGLTGTFRPLMLRVPRARLQ